MFFIIIPTFNREKTILRAISSCINNFKQAHECGQIIVIDDGSTDNTSKILGNIINTNKVQIKYKYYPKNKGVGYARNIGIETALSISKNHKDDFIIFLDSDDAFSGNAFEIIKKTIESKNKSLYRFGIQFSSGINASWFSVHKTREYNIIDWIKGEKFGGDFNPVIRLSIFDSNIRFSEECNGGEGIFRSKILKNNNVLLCPQTTVIQYVDFDGLTHGKLDIKKCYNSIKCIELLLKEIGPLYQQYNPYALAEYYYSLARFYALVGEYKISFIYFNKGIKIRKDFKKFCLYVISCLDYKLYINNLLFKLYYSYKTKTNQR